MHSTIRITPHYGGFATVLGPVWACTLVCQFFTPFLLFGTKKTNFEQKPAVKNMSNQQLVEFECRAIHIMSSL